MIGAGRVAQMNLGGPLTRRHTPSLQTSVSSGLQSGSKNVYPIDLPEGFATGLSTLTGLRWRKSPTPHSQWRQLSHMATAGKELWLLKVDTNTENQIIP